MSLTMMATCWNQRSLLRESTGAGRPCGARILGQLDEFVAQPQARGAHPQPENALQMLVVRSIHFVLGDLFETDEARFV